MANSRGTSSPIMRYSKEQIPHPEFVGEVRVHTSRYKFKDKRGCNLTQMYRGSTCEEVSLL